MQPVRRGNQRQNGLEIQRHFEETRGRLERKIYDLEERTFQFAVAVRAFVKKLKPTSANTEDTRQLIRASGSVGSNYIEANEALSKKDFLFRIKICRKEAKESRFFLRLLDAEGPAKLESQRANLVQEAQELMNIFGAIFRKSE